MTVCSESGQGDRAIDLLLVALCSLLHNALRQENENAWWREYLDSPGVNFLSLEVRRQANRCRI
jgi:hypothetical protein